MDNTAISIKLINGKWCLLRYPPTQYIRNSHKLIRGEPKILKRFTTQEAAAAAADEIRNVPETYQVKQIIKRGHRSCRREK